MSIENHLAHPVSKENFSLYEPSSSTESVDPKGQESAPQKEAQSGVTHVRQKLRQARSLADTYTFAKPCCVSDTPDAHTVWIKVGNQSFSIDGYQDTLAEANWMRLMLGKAIQTILSENFNAAGAAPVSQKDSSSAVRNAEGKGFWRNKTR